MMESISSKLQSTGKLFRKYLYEGMICGRYVTTYLPDGTCTALEEVSGEIKQGKNDHG